MAARGVTPKSGALGVPKAEQYAATSPLMALKRLNNGHSQRECLHAAARFPVEPLGPSHDGPKDPPTHGRSSVRSLRTRESRAGERRTPTADHRLFWDVR